ncbi:GntR family transcriptional regulator [Kineococcus rhizosphaerae]|uniref:GntR family transcriptional regulator n=1 Tax=Kineococcus rhizosphaerae TaxID=559628 RepID=A0A2T0QZJ1_9ACTN|nr:GntR family transcriptional regulator [Kineococcus rhizosphaerae]PRY12104.1 GntR family transcriptional regulator [Kineococcus rhizosphaerae]
MHAQRRGGATDRTYARLREDVLDGVLAPGAVLAELEQSARLGVSRTPVREAFARLVHDGLARPVGGRGLVVAPLDLGDLDHLYDVREALEVKAARLAARSGEGFEGFVRRFAHAPDLVAAGELDRYYALSAEFDAAVDAATANPWLVRALDDVRTHLVRIRRLARHDPDRLRAAASEHRLVAEALTDGDADLAAHAVHVHLHRSRSHFRQRLTTPTEESA